MHLIQLAELLIGLWLLSLLHLIYLRISLAFLTNSSLMELFCKNIQLILELLKGPFLGLILKTFLESVLQIRLEDVLKTSWKTKNCYAEDVLKTSWKTRNVCWDTTMQLNSFRYVLKVIIVFSCYRTRYKS